MDPKICSDIRIEFEISEIILRIENLQKRVTKETNNAIKTMSAIRNQITTSVNERL